MDTTAAFVIGVIFGAVLVVVIYYFRQKNETELIISRARDAFTELSSKNTQEFLLLARDKFVDQQTVTEKVFEGKKAQIDQTFESMKTELGEFRQLITRIESDRSEKQGKLSQQLAETAKQISALTDTTGKLQNVLASAKSRGQWGEKMAEDILRLSGFIEGVNYQKQTTMLTVNTRPDYTFLLPQGRKVNMDVKFPLDNYVLYCNCDIEIEKERYKRHFLKDVRSRVNEITTRDYINPAENTLDYVILFIPSDQIYSFINEQDYGVFFEDALKKRVVVCSPLTLYAILAIIRQAIDNFKLETTTSEMLSLFGTFSKQWSDYKLSYEKLGKRIDDVKTEFQALTSTRTNKLEVPLRKIEELREREDITIALLEDETVLLEDENDLLGFQDLEDRTN
jgi:DNA recombination protein RmuC